jgi:hypothetical protein
MKAFVLSVLVMLSIFAPKVFADAKITGGTRYKFGTDNATVTFGCDGVTNPSKENVTPKLMMRLYACDAPYKGGQLNGTVLGSYPLDGLKPGAGYTAVSKNVTTTLPAAKRSYFICLTVLELRASGYVITDYRNFADTLLLAPAKLLKLTGPWTWQSNPAGGTIDLTVAKISHTRPGNTGSLKLAVWATEEPYTGGAIRGFELGSIKKDALKPGFSYSDVKNTASFKAPPGGRYYVSLLLLEFGKTEEYVIMDYIAGSKPTTFK